MNNIEAEWFNGKRPWDHASCGRCLTAHSGSYGCTLTTHAPLRTAVNKLVKAWGTVIPHTEEQVREAVKLRKKFTRFYPRKKK